MPHIGLNPHIGGHVDADAGQIEGEIAARLWIPDRSQQ